jgi:hypothetical protein
LGFFDLQADHPSCEHDEGSASHVLGRHYRVLPQRLVANSLSVSMERCICGAKPPVRSARRAAHPVRTTHPRVRGPSLRCRSRRASAAAKPECSGRDACAVSCLGRSLGSTLCAATSGSTARAHVRNELHLTPSRSAGASASSRSGARPRPSRDDEAIPFGAQDRGPVRPLGFPRGSWERYVPPRRDFARPFSRRLPPTAGPPRWHGGARHAAGIRRRLPWSWFPFGV